MNARSESGISLIMTVGVLLALSTMGATVLAFSASNARHAVYSTDRAQAIHIAEAGEAYARSILWNAPDPTDPNAVGSGSVSLEGGTATYSGTYDSSTQTWTISGTAAIPNPTGGETIIKTVSSAVQITAGATTAPWAIFVGDSDCSNLGLDINGNNTVITGGIHSNGRFSVDGNNETFGYASTFGPPCEVITNGPNHDYGGGATAPTVDPTVYGWPYTFAQSDFTCDFSGSVFSFTNHNATIPTGTYCATTRFEIAANHQDGEFTAIAPEILISGQNHDFTPHEHDVLFFGTGNQLVELDGNSYSYEGIVYNPGGRVFASGNTASTLSGLIMAGEVEINGNSFSMNGTGGPQGSGPANAPGLANVSGSHKVQ